MFKWLNQVTSQANAQTSGYNAETEKFLDRPSLSRTQIACAANLWFIRYHTILANRVYESMYASYNSLVSAPNDEMRNIHGTELAKSYKMFMSLIDNICSHSDRLGKIEDAHRALNSQLDSPLFDPQMKDLGIGQLTATEEMLALIRDEVDKSLYKPDTSDAGSSGSGPHFHEA